MILPQGYKELIERNPNLEFIKWDQYHSHDGDFKIDDIEIMGEFINDELNKCTEDIYNFLKGCDNLLETFGNQVTIKISKLDSIEIKENNKI